MMTSLVLALLLSTTPAEPERGFPSRWDVQLDLVNSLFPVGEYAGCSFKPVCGIGLAAQVTWKLTSWGLIAGARQHAQYDYSVTTMLRFTTEANLGFATSDVARWQAFGGVLAGVKWGVSSATRSFQNGTLSGTYTGWAARFSLRLNAGGRFFITPRVGIVVQVFFPLYAMIPDLTDGDSTLLSIGVTWL